MKQFEKELENIHNSIRNMGNLVVDRINRAIEALKNRDTEEAKKIIATDDDVDIMEVEIDKLCTEILAVRQPLATDLRILITALKINVDLERIGDLAVNIAERVLDLADKPLLKPLIDIPAMKEKVIKMVNDGLEAHRTHNTALAKKVCLEDKEIDALNEQVFREILTYMMADASCIPRALPLIMIARYLERVGDHATNIAENVIFMVDAKMVRHRYSKL